MIKLKEPRTWRSAAEDLLLKSGRDKISGFAKKYLKKRVGKFILNYGPRRLRNAQERRLESSPFFTRYPYQGPLRLKSVDAHAVIDTELKIFFHRIPKSASSSLTASIVQLREGKALPESQEFKRNIRRSLTRPSELSIEDVQTIEQLKKVVFVRNPYSRVLSAYRSKVLAHWMTDKAIRIDVTSKAEMQPIPTFAEFCRFLASGGLYRNHHWYPQIDYLAFPLKQYDFIGRLETIDEDFKRLAVFISGNETALTMLAEDPTHRSRSSEAVRENFTPELFELVFKTYKRDFEAFGYSERYESGGS